MMFKKALTKSGRRILKAIKKISNARLAKKLEQQQLQHQQQQEKQQQDELIQMQQEANWRLQARLYELDNCSVASCSLPSSSFDETKSVDTFVTYVADGYLQDDCYLPYCCCHCDEREENQRNENLENEMMR